MKWKQAVQYSKTSCVTSHTSLEEKQDNKCAEIMHPLHILNKCAEIMHPLHILMVAYNKKYIEVHTSYNT